MDRTQNVSDGFILPSNTAEIQINKAWEPLVPNVPQLSCPGPHFIEQSNSSPHFQLSEEPSSHWIPCYAPIHLLSCRIPVATTWRHPYPCGICCPLSLNALFPSLRINVFDFSGVLEPLSNGHSFLVSKSCSPRPGLAPPLHTPPTPAL